MVLSKEGEKKYWRTLIILYNSSHRNDFKVTCERRGVSPSKVLGLLIRSFIDEHKEN